MLATWYSAKELAGLPGLPKAITSISRKAVNDGWQRQQVEGVKGRSFQYHIDNLPEETQKHLRQQQAKAEIAAASEERKRIRKKYAEPTNESSSEEKLQAMALMDGWSESRKTRCLARHEVVMACERYLSQMAQLGTKKEEAKAEFIALFNQRNLDFDEDVYQSLNGSISKASLYRWHRAFQQGGIAAMDKCEGRNKDGYIIEEQPEMKQFALGFIAEFPHTQGRKLLKAIKAEFRHSELKLPSETATRRWLDWWKEKNASLFESMSNPDAWKNSYMVAFGSASEGIERLNQLWELDATPADLECTLSDGSKRRYHITASLDVWSRTPKMLVTETPRTEANAALMRRAILSEGKPEKVKIDNGSDYVSKAMMLILDMLGIDYEVCPPFSPWKKPHVERFFRSFSHDLLELKPGFVGHNVAERKAIEARKTFAERLMKKDEVIDVTMTPEELQQFCDDWVENIYMHKVHEGINSTPLAKRASYQGPITTIDNERALDQLLSVPAQGGMRTVTKQGVKIDNIYYIAPELALCVGQQVFVRLDKDDLGQVVISDLDGAFICVASNAEYKGVNREEIAIEAKRMQREQLKAAKKEVAAAKRKFKPKDIADRIMSDARDVAQTVTQFPKKEVPYTNEAIQGAADAVEALDGHEPAFPTVTQEQMDIVNHMLRDDQKQNETEEDRFRRWLDLNDLVKSGEVLDEFNAEWKTRYESTPEFKGRHMVWEDFGDSAFR